MERLRGHLGIGRWLLLDALNRFAA